MANDAMVSIKTKRGPEYCSVLMITLCLSTMGAIFLAGMTFLVNENKLKLSRKNDTIILRRDTYYTRLEYVMRYQIIGLLWLLLCMFNVILKRIFTSALNPLAGREDITLYARNVLNNSFEQFFMSMTAQIISISYMEKKYLIKVIPLVNYSFIIGRVTYWLGYPKFRGFGLMLTLIPTSLLAAYDFYKFIKLSDDIFK